MRFIFSIYIFFLIILPLISSCSQKKEFLKNDNDVSPRFDFFLVISDSAFALGSVVRFAIVVRNISSGSISITFSNLCLADFIVEREGEIIWRKSDGKMCAQMLVQKSVPPGDSIKIEGEWDSFSSKDKKVSLGKYSLRGLLYSIPPIESKEVYFYLVD